MQRAGPPAAPAPTTRARILVGLLDLGKVQFRSWAKLADDVSARVLHRNRAELSRSHAQLAEERGERAADRAGISILDLERDAEAVRGGRAEKSLGTALRDPARTGL